MDNEVVVIVQVVVAVFLLVDVEVDDVVVVLAVVLDELEASGAVLAGALSCGI